MKIKRYSTIDEIRRDLLSITREFTEIKTQVDQFQEALASTYKRIRAATIKLRDSTKPVTIKPSSNTKISNILKNKDIRETFSQLERLTEQERVINNIVIQLEQNFDQSQAKKTLEKTRKLKRAIAKELGHVKKLSDKVATRHVPQMFKSRVEQIYSRLQKQLKGRFTDSSIKYIIAGVNGTIQYTSYLRFNDLEDDDGYTYSEFYIMISEVVNRVGQANFHLTTLTDFRLPGKFALSRYSKLDDLKRINDLVSDKLASEKLISRAQPKKLPLTPQQIKFSNRNIDKTEVRDNRIFITLKDRTSEKLAHQTRRDLQSQLFTLIRAKHPRNRDIIRGKVYKSRNRWRIQFILTISLSYKGITLDVSTRSELKKILNLNDRQLNKLQDALDQLGN